MNRQEIRQNMRVRRRSLSRKQQHLAAAGLQQQLGKSREFRRAKRVALYLANDGEIDPITTIRSLWQRRVAVYLPVLHPVYKGHLSFVRFTPTSRMQPNRYGISEPVYRHQSRIAARFLDVIAMPLVAFDDEGNRLGMGGGYYDRSLAFTRSQGKSVFLIGCAHECQRFQKLPIEPWDIPLNAIATDTRYQPI